VALLVACGGSGGAAPSGVDAAPPSPGSSRYPEAPDAGVTPVEAGPGAAGVSGCKPELDALFADYAVPGAPGAAVAIVKDGALICARSYGLADLPARTPVTTKTNFRINSNTKAFTAMAILILKERGLLDLTTSVTDVFPDFPAYGRAITVRHLLNHTSGIADYECPATRSERNPMTDADVLEQLRAQTATAFPPGTAFEYSNAGYSLLSSIAAKVSGQTFARLVREEILDKLGMRASMVFDPHHAEPIPARAFGYALFDNRVGFELLDDECSTGVLGDGNLYSNAEDMALWTASLDRESPSRLVSQESLNLAFTSGTPAGSTPYGFGWLLGRYRGLVVHAHDGGSGGFYSHIQRYPERRFAIVVLTNRADFTDASKNDITTRIGLPIADAYLFGR